MTDNDDPAIPSINVTQAMVEAEARRFAKQTSGLLLGVMAESGTSEEQMTARLGASPGSLTNHLLGNISRGYLPLAALCLALEIRLDLHVSSTDSNSTPTQSPVTPN
jgi:hypothetical protein